MKPKNIKQLQAESRQLNVRRVNHNTLVVESASNPYTSQVVTVTFAPDGEVHARCTCQWAQYRGVACSHVMAALEYLASQKGRTLSFWLTNSEAQRQKHRRFYLRGKGSPDEGVWITSRTPR